MRLWGTLKTTVTNNKTKEAPDATSRLNNTNNQKNKPATTGHAQTNKCNKTKQTHAATRQAGSTVTNNKLKEHLRLRAGYTCTSKQKQKAPAAAGQAQTIKFNNTRKCVPLRCMLKTKVATNKTKEAPADTGRLNKTNKQKKKACGNGAGENKHVY